MRRDVPITSVIGIVTALISINVLRDRTDLSEPLNWIIAIGIAFLVTVTFVFIMGALGKYPHTDRPSPEATPPQ